MELKDLKTGMIVELRDGNRYVVIANSAATLGMNIEKDDFTYFYLAHSYNSYNEDFTHKGNRRLDIVKISQIQMTEMSDFVRIVNGAIPIWERAKPKKMTVSEICKELGYEVEIVRDDS